MPRSPANCWAVFFAPALVVAIVSRSRFVTNHLVGERAVFSGHVPRVRLLIVASKSSQCLLHVAQLAGAFHAVGLFLGLGQGGEEHTREDANNGYHHQQFDQGKCLFGFHFSILLGL